MLAALHIWHCMARQSMTRQMCMLKVCGPVWLGWVGLQISRLARVCISLGATLTLLWLAVLYYGVRLAYLRRIIDFDPGGAGIISNHSRG